MSTSSDSKRLTRKATPHVAVHMSLAPTSAASNALAVAAASALARPSLDAPDAPDASGKPGKPRKPRRLSSKPSSDGSLRTQAGSSARVQIGLSPSERRRREAEAKASANATAKATPTPLLETVAMRGSGFYNENCAPQRAAVAKGVPYFVRAAQALPPALVANRAVVIADYGSSQGRNSVAPIAAALDVLSLPLSRAASIEVVHQDLPSNDFNSLFRVVASPEEGYTAGRANVFVSAKGGSFYSRLFPPNSVALGWSSTAAHWLSQPSPLKGAFNNLHAPQRNAELEDIARRDWAAYVAHREAELAPGGQLVQVEIANVEGPSREKHVRFIQAVYDSLVDALGADAAMDVTAPVYMRTKTELLAPFREGGTSKLVVREAEELHPDDVFLAEFDRTGDVELLVNRLVGFVDAAITPCFKLERFPPERVRRFYEALRGRFQRDPREVTAAYPVVVLRLEKPSDLKE